MTWQRRIRVIYEKVFIVARYCTLWVVTSALVEAEKCCRKSCGFGWEWAEVHRVKNCDVTNVSKNSSSKIYYFFTFKILKNNFAEHKSFLPLIFYVHISTQDKNLAKSRKKNISPEISQQNAWKIFSKCRNSFRFFLISGAIIVTSVFDCYSLVNCKTMWGIVMRRLMRFGTFACLIQTFVHD